MPHVRSDLHGLRIEAAHAFWPVTRTGVWIKHKIRSTSFEIDLSECTVYVAVTVADVRIVTVRQSIANVTQASCLWKKQHRFSNRSGPFSIYNTLAIYNTLPSTGMLIWPFHISWREIRCKVMHWDTCKEMRMLHRTWLQNKCILAIKTVGWISNQTFQDRYREEPVGKMNHVKLIHPLPKKRITFSKTKQKTNQMGLIQVVNGCK